MKTYKKPIRFDSAQNIVAYCRDLDLRIEILDGTLLDNVLIYNYGKVKIDNIQPRNYIILQETYKNCYSSRYTLICTDDETLVEDFQLQLEAQLEYELFCENN